MTEPNRGDPGPVVSLTSHFSSSSHHITAEAAQALLTLLEIFPNVLYHLEES